MLLVYSDEKDWTDESRMACMRTSMKLCEDLDAKGQYIDSSPLHYVEDATSVRVREGKRLVTDGPFAETAEQLGGFYLVDVPDLDEAIRIAERIPAAAKGTIEIRPVFDLSQVPDA
jgi:hypothetical protein